MLLPSNTSREGYRSGTFTLLDYAGNPVGQIQLILRLSALGSALLAHMREEEGHPGRSNAPRLLPTVHRDGGEGDPPALFYANIDEAPDGSMGPPAARSGSQGRISSTAVQAAASSSGDKKKAKVTPDALRAAATGRKAPVPTRPGAAKPAVPAAKKKISTNALEKAAGRGAARSHDPYADDGLDEPVFQAGSKSRRAEQIEASLGEFFDRTHAVSAQLLLVLL